MKNIIVQNLQSYLNNYHINDNKNHEKKQARPDQSLKVPDKYRIQAVFDNFPVP